MSKNLKIKFKKINSGGSLVASAQVSLSPGIWIKDWMIFDSNGKISSSPPSRKYQDKDGNTKYSSYIYFEDKETYWQWCNNVADCYKEWIEDGGDNEEEKYHREQDKEAEGLKPSDVEGDDEFTTPF